MRVWPFILSVTAVSIAAEMVGDQGERDASERQSPEAPRSRSRVELELKLAKADLGLVNAGADLDEKRRVFAGIIEDHGPVDEPVSPVEEDSAEALEPVELVLPLREGLTAEEFFDEATMFMAGLQAACSRDLRSSGDLDAARKLYAEMLEKESVKGLLIELEEVREELAQATASEEEGRVLPTDDATDLSTGEAAAAMVAREWEALVEEGRDDDLEEVRRRMDLAHVAATQELETEKEAPPPPDIRIRQRITELETELAATNNHSTNSTPPPTR